MFQNKSNVDSRIQDFIQSMDSCLYKILSTENMMEKGEIIDNFLNENIKDLFDLKVNFFVKFTNSFIHRIRKKIDNFLKEIETASKVNLRTNPEIIAAHQLLNDFFNNNEQDSIPEPIDFLNIYKDALTRIKVDKYIQRKDITTFHDFFSTYKAIFSIMQHIPKLASFKESFAPILSAEKLPKKYQFEIDGENVEFSFTVHSTVSNAKASLATHLGVPASNIIIRYSKFNSNSNNGNNNGYYYNFNNVNNPNNNFFVHLNDSNHNYIYFNYIPINPPSDKNNNNENTYESNENKENSTLKLKAMINEMPLTYYLPPFIVEYKPPPPTKYLFNTPKKTVSKVYDYTKTVADVKSDLKTFLQHEVQCAVNGTILEDHQKLSSLNIENSIIQVTFTPDFTFALPNDEIIEDSFQSNTSLYDVYNTISPKISFPFILQYNNEPIYTYSEPVGDKINFDVVKSNKIIRFFQYPDQTIKLHQFDENENIEGVKMFIKTQLHDMNKDKPPETKQNDDLSISENKSFSELLNGSADSSSEEEFILVAKNKVLKKLTMPISYINSSELIYIKPTDSLLIHFLVANHEKYELRFKKTSTVKEAKAEVANLFKCVFTFMKKEKPIKDSKLLILISPPVITIDMPITTYHFQFPDGKKKKHEFSPIKTIQEIKKFVAIHQKCNVENIQLSMNKKVLKNSKYLYEIDRNALIVISVLIILPFYIQSKSKQSTKMLSFENTATIKNVREFLSMKTRTSEDRLTFFDENDILLNDNKPLSEIEKDKTTNVILAQKHPVFDDFEIQEIEKVVTDNLTKEKACDFYVKCGKNMERFMKNISNFS